MLLFEALYSLLELLLFRSPSTLHHEEISRGKKPRQTEKRFWSLMIYCDSSLGDRKVAWNQEVKIKVRGSFYRLLCRWWVCLQNDMKTETINPLAVAAEQVGPEKAELHKKILLQGNLSVHTPCKDQDSAELAAAARQVAPGWCQTTLVHAGSLFPVEDEETDVSGFDTKTFFFTEWWRHLNWEVSLLLMTY